MRKCFSVILFTFFPVWGWSQVPPSSVPTQTFPFHSSSNGLSNNLNWTNSGENYNFAGRHFHSSAVMNNRLWVIGGIASGKVMSDVLYSIDGLNWNLATATAAFGSRWGQASLVFDAGQGANLWVIGGSDSKNFFNDVWHSSDGVNWSLVTAAAPFTARSRAGAVVFNNKMWVIGGTSQSGFLNDIWCSSDGKTWTQVTPKETFPARYSASLTVHHNLLWLVAGESATGALNDVWSSPDGVNWTIVSANAGFPARASHTAEAYQGLLWVFGGHDIAVPNIFNDAWWSANGSQWTQAVPSSNYSPRWGQSSAVFNGQIWIINGATGPRDNPVDYSDVWNTGNAPSPTPGLTSTNTPTLTATHAIATVTSTATLIPTKTNTPTFTPMNNNPTAIAVSAVSVPLVTSAVIVPHVIHSGKPVKLLLTLVEPAQVQWTISSSSGQQLYQVTVQGQSGLNTLVWQGTNSFNQPVGDGVYSYVIETQVGMAQTTTPGKIFIRN